MAKQSLQRTLRAARRAAELFRYTALTVAAQISGRDKTAMAATSAIVRALENLGPCLLQMLRPLLPLMKRYKGVVGLLICLPPVLFFLLVSSKVFHWWDFPWSERGAMWLLRWMTLGAIINALIYGLASVLFFLTWWRNRLHVSGQMRPRLALTYTFTPLFYGFAVAWGVTSMKGLPRDAFAYLALSTFVLMAFGNTLLRISERNKALHSTA